MMGTNKEILGKKSTFNEPVMDKGGRPKVNRALVIKNLKLKDSRGLPRYTKAQIGRMMKCSSKTIRRIYNDGIETGEINPEEFSERAIGIVEADFDSECERAKGFSYREWLSTRFGNKTQAQYYFNFSSKIWHKIFDKCDLADMADINSQLADQMALKFVVTFQEDKNRMRTRLKQIRFLFKFLGRQDINDKHLSMSNSKHPRSKRRIPEISNTNFPLIYKECEDELVKVLGEDARLEMRLKIVTQMRTGSWKAEREFYGIQKGTAGKTYLSMVNADEYQFHVFAKKGEEWDVIWMPRWVKDRLWERYQTMERGEKLTKYSKARLLKAWGDITERRLGTRLILHDLRKISLTWLYTMGVPLEVATQLNVGWKDLSTAHSHYIDIKRVLRKSYRAEYRENIPDWFKEGLDDFTGFEAIVPAGGGSALGAIQGTGHFGVR